MIRGAGGDWAVARDVPLIELVLGVPRTISECRQCAVASASSHVHFLGSLPDPYVSLLQIVQSLVYMVRNDAARARGYIQYNYGLTVLCCKRALLQLVGYKPHCRQAGNLLHRPVPSFSNILPEGMCSSR
jgi:hypothetical protein